LTWDEAERLLAARLPRGILFGLERTRRALAALGDPQREFRALHVAGTNGKGSCCAYLEAGLLQAGVRTGLYTSPHLVSLTERFRVAGVEVSRDRLLAALEEVLRACPWATGAAEDEGLTFFELLTVTAFQLFAAERVEVAVLETGLGGRLDATATCEPIATGITQIAVDHVQYLGSDPAGIAREKAGIARAGIPCVVARQSPAVLSAIESECALRGAPVRVEGRDFELPPGFAPALRGAHQRSNAAVAAEMLACATAAGVPVTREQARAGVRAARWPGRLESIAGRPELVLDGAHNPAAAEALARAVRELWPGRRVHLVLGCMRDKDAAGIVRALCPLAVNVWFTSVRASRALPAAELLALWPDARAVEPAAEAVARARAAAAPEDLVLVAGSLYLVGEVRSGMAPGLSEANLGISGPARVR
jgi:dihydrofolate synthase/folylpolyglutamate synthase